jgi:hypothetical protein
MGLQFTCHVFFSLPPVLRSPYLRNLLSIYSVPDFFPCLGNIAIFFFYRHFLNSYIAYDITFIYITCAYRSKNLLRILIFNISLPDKFSSEGAHVVIMSSLSGTSSSASFFFLHVPSCTIFNTS